MLVKPCRISIYHPIVPISHAWDFAIRESLYVSMLHLSPFESAMLDPSVFEVAQTNEMMSSVPEVRAMYQFDLEKMVTALVTFLRLVTSCSALAAEPVGVAGVDGGRRGSRGVAVVAGPRRTDTGGGRSPPFSPPISPVSPPLSLPAILLFPPRQAPYCLPH